MPVYSAFGASVVFLFVASFLPDLRLWGINWYAHFGWTGRVLLLVAAAISVAISLIAVRKRGLNSGQKSLNWPVVAITLTLAATFLFWLLRVQTHFLGDGYLLLSRLEAGTRPIRPWNIAAYFVQENVYDLLGRSGSDNALLTFQLMAVGSGLLLAVATCYAATRLYKGLWDRLLFSLGAVTGGFALLFFGYVENYSVFLFLVWLFGIFSLLTLAGEARRWAVVIPVVLAGLFHPFAVAMIPAMLYILLQGTAAGDWVAARSTSSKVGTVVGAVILLGVLFQYFFAESQFLRHALVPVVADDTTVEGYTMFSGKHLVDMLNLIFVLAPAILVASAMAWSGKLLRQLSAEQVFLWLFLVPSLAIAFVFDPKLGMPRDWDLFAFCGVPLVLLSLWWVLDARHKTSLRFAIGLLAVMLQIIVLAPRIASQLTPERGIELFDNYAALDAQKNRKGETVLIRYLQDHGMAEEAERRLAEHLDKAQEGPLVQEGMRLAGQGKYREAIGKVRRALDINPGYYVAWNMLGRFYSHIHMHDSALACLDIADGLNPYNFTNYNAYGLAYLNHGDFEKGEEWLLKASDLDDSNLEALEMLFELYRQQGRREEYLRTLETLARHPQGHYRYMVFMAQEYTDQHKYDQAAAMIIGAVDKGLDPSRVEMLKEQVPELREALERRR